MGLAPRALSGSILLPLALLGLAAVLVTPARSAARVKPLPALTPARPDALTRALAAGRLDEAEYALERARSLFRVRTVRREFGPVARPRPRDATLVLRDLALRLRFLSGGERSEAERVLARPDAGGVPIGNGWTAPEAPQSPDCDGTVCVHWVANGPDAPSPAGWATTTLGILQDVWAEEIDAIGYRPPLSDASSTHDGGGPELDVYLDDLGNDGVFGYCTSDDPNASSPTVFAVSAYCVLDNDYAAVQYGTRHTPLEFLQVTAAHEFNHASQFAYDWLEDYWLLEGTATNMEETVYPAIDDNVGFLANSQLSHPAVPLDRGGFGDTEYGAWIFWRYLEEKAYGGDPTVIRRVWQDADAATPFAPDSYSLQATRRVLRADGRSFPNEFASYAVANRLHAYADGALYPPTPTHRSFTVGIRQPSTGWRGRRLDHLATQYLTFRPGRRVSPTARLRVDVDLAPWGSRATLISYAKSGAVTVLPIALGEGARGHRLAAFGRGTIARVDLVLSNGSYRTTCFTDLEAPPFYSCFGTPTDDDRRELFRAALR